MAGRPPKNVSVQKEEAKKILSEKVEVIEPDTVQESEAEELEESQDSTKEDIEEVEKSQDFMEEMEVIKESITELLESFMNKKKLVAVIPVLYRSRQYQVGETLPAADKDMVEAWIDSGAAKWIRDMPDSVKAKLASAEPGAIGKMLDDSAGLIGKIERKYGREL